MSSFSGKKTVPTLGSMGAQICSIANVRNPEMQVSMYRGHLQSREYLLLAVNNAPPPKPVVIKMTQGE